MHQNLILQVCLHSEPSYTVIAPCDTSVPSTGLTSEMFQQRRFLTNVRLVAWPNRPKRVNVWAACTNTQGQALTDCRERSNSHSQQTCRQQTTASGRSISWLQIPRTPVSRGMIIHPSCDGVGWGRQIGCTTWTPVSRGMIIHPSYDGVGRQIGCTTPVSRLIIIPELRGVGWGRQIGCTTPVSRLIIIPELPGVGWGRQIGCTTRTPPGLARDDNSSKSWWSRLR